MMKKQLAAILLTLALSLSLCACAPSTPTEVDTTTKFTSEGFTLSIPNEYKDLLIIDTTVTEGRGSMFFSVREKASVEACKKLYGNDLGAGFLFGIGRLNESDFKIALCGDMSGSEVFAKDDAGYYYMYYRPTDVQLIREGDCTDADWAQWAELGQWGSSATDMFIVENEGLTPYYRTNTDLDIFLNRLAYLPDEYEFTLTRPDTDKAPVPSKELSLPYLEQLMNGTFTYVDKKSAPECEYISLNLPDSLVRFDFFLAENGDANYVRQVWGDGMEALYLATYEDGTLAGQTMLGWYIAAMQAQ